MSKGWHQRNKTDEMTAADLQEASAIGGIERLISSVWIRRLVSHIGARDAEIKRMRELEVLTLRKSVEITVFRNGKVLAVNSRNFDGFCGVGGKVEPGETFEQAARRELMEETGCRAEGIEFVAGHTLDPIPGDDAAVEWYCAGFVVDIGDQEPRQNEPGTVPYWTTREDMVANSLFPEWYAWWFGILDMRGKR